MKGPLKVRRVLGKTGNPEAIWEKTVCPPAKENVEPQTAEGVTDRGRD